MSLRFALANNGPLVLFEKPEKNVKYTIGVDAATGVGKDWTVFQVLSNQKPFSQVARYRAKVDTVDGTRAMVNLGKYYNTALLVIETRFPGNAYADAAVKIYRYPRIYRKEEYIDCDPNISDKLGITTTRDDKWRFINEVNEQFSWNNFVCSLWDPQTVDELINYVFIEDKSKTGASEGLNDDCVDALFLAIHGAVLYPQKPRPQRPKQILSADAAQQRAMLKAFTEKVELRFQKGEPVTIL